MESMLMSIPGDQQSEPDSECEARWIDAARSDPAAFEPLYLRYHIRIYRYLRTRLASNDDAADVTHQVFLIALETLPRYQQRGLPFAAWLFRIAHHTALNLKRRQHPTLSWDALPEELHPLTGQDPEMQTMQQETLTHLRAWLATLKADQRELLALRFAAGLTVPQIAAVIGKKPDAAKKQLSRLLQSYKECFHNGR